MPSNEIFRNEAAKFVYIRTYSRWIEVEKRREMWQETVERYIKFISDERGEFIPPKVIRKIKENILNFQVMPSMRALWAAGPAAKIDNTTMYNCSFLGIDSPTAFAEIFYILMCGAGVGFSVESKFIDKFPIIPMIDTYKVIKYLIPDDKAGWAESVKILIESFYEGKDVEFDYGSIRPRGSRLKTMGGRASGSAPLITLHNFIRDTFLSAQNRKLTTLECHDIANQIADSVVVGGVRRSSQISLSDLNDEKMRHAKDWPFPPRRYMANNSAIYHEKPTAVDFLKEWSSLAASGTGERGISNMYATKLNTPSRRNEKLIEGSNPCHEIMLRNNQFCNLSEVVIRREDDLDSLLEKVETAVWIGVIQSTFTNFPYLNKKWKKNCEEERLLGVSLTGQLDNPTILSEDALKALKARSLKVAKRASEKMGINMPTAITTVKPSGTVSQLVDSSSGIHPRYAKFYIRRYRISTTDPLFKMIKNQGIKVIPENGQEKLPEKEVSTWIIEFPIKSPEKSITKNDMGAIAQLEWYKKIQENWCEHNASMTVYVKNEEWFEVGNWVYKNWDIINGVSFLPFDGGRYQKAPYEEITEKEYNNLVKNFKQIDYSELSKYEMEDNTEGSKSYSCTGDKCEIT
jgi:ribonucleoside-triphosphate reductase